jgi:hypothetical protein
MQDERCRKAVEASEQFADGLISERRLDNLSAEAEEAFDEAIREPDGDQSPVATIAHAASYSSSPSLEIIVLLEATNAVVAVAKDGRENELMALSSLLRDIFGNPFRPITLDPRWLTSTVLDLARLIYDERAFDRLPILADALMDAGCDSEELLKHCRSEGPHVRGCWVVDLILGKS